MNRLKIALITLLSLSACRRDDGPPPAVQSGSAQTDPNSGGASATGKQASSSEAVNWEDSLGTCSVSGKVSFLGEAPSMAPIDMSQELKCGSDNQEEGVLVQDGGLANVVISVSQGLVGYEFAPGTGDFLLNQEGCRYVPHVVAMRAGMQLVIANSDPLTHNVNSKSRRNRGFNDAQPAGAPPLQKAMNRREGMFSISCDMHAWMRCFVSVFEHPFYTVSDSNGAFSLPKLPPGKYTLTAEHETLGKQKVEVTVGSEESVSANFSFGQSSSN